MSELAVGSLKGLAANDFVIDVAAGSTLNVPPPAILQVVQAVKTDVFSMSSPTFAPVTGLTATITPSSASSKILILLQMSVSASNAGGAGPRFRLTGGNAGTYIGNADGGATRAVAGFYTEGGTFLTRFQMLSAMANFLDSPATTSPITYGVEINTQGGTVFVNNLGIQGTSADYLRGASSITVMEVAG